MYTLCIYASIARTVIISVLLGTVKAVEEQFWQKLN